MERNGNPSLRLRMLFMVACFSTSKATDSDIRCLRSIKESLEDPSGRAFSSWEFNDVMFEGSICRFEGVQCRHDSLNMLYSIRLAGMSLRGPFPIDKTDCTKMESLDLSRNNLSGPIPSNIGALLPFIVYLDLSDNNLSGPIPPSIVNWRYINVLRLENNHLTGQIPPDLTALDRVKIFDVANNRLSGHVPMFGTSIYFSAESYEMNSGLCGGPLKACKDDDHDINFLSGFAVGFSLFTILSMLFMFFYFPWDV